MPIKFELPTIIEIINVETVAASALNTTDLSIDGYLALDGYIIDLSAGVSLNQILQYNGTSFVAADIGGGSGDLLGTLNANKVPYATAIHTIADSNMSWDNTNKTLTIDTNSNSAGLKVSDSGRTFEIKPDLTNNLITLGVSTNHDLGFYTNSMPIQMTLTTDGYLGIGRSPLYLLDAYGDIRTSQRIIIDNSSASVSPSNMGAFRYNVSTQHLEFSENGSAWQQLGTGGGGNLSGTLTTGLIPYASASGTLSNTNLTWDVADDYLGVRQPAPTATLDVLEANATSGNPLAFKITGGSHTTLPASTEVNDINFALNRTVQLNTGALGTQRAVVLSAPTYSFVGASTITTAATLAVTNAPQAGTNATITKPYSIWAQAGVAAFDGHIKVDGYTVDLSAGATTNQVLQYNGTSFVAATVSGTMAIGGSITSATSGSVLYVNSSSQLAQDNSNFFWDATNHRLGLGTTSPGTALDVRNNSATLGTMYLRNINASGVSQVELYNNSGTFKLAVGASNTGGDTYAYTGASTDFSIQTNNGSQKHIFKSGGTVGLGSATPNASNRLEVSGAMTVGTYTNTAAPTNGLIVSGSVGIGTSAFTNSAINLEVRNANGNAVGGQFAMRNTNSAGQTELDVYDSSANFRMSFGFDNNSIATTPNAFVYTGTSTNFRIYVNNAATTHIFTSSGGLGLNTTVVNASNRLEVGGAVAIGTSYSNTVAPTNGLIVQGAVGIGTSSPGSTFALFVVGTSSTDGVATYKNTSSTGYSNIRYEKSDGTFEGSIGFANASAAITHLQNKMHLFSGGPNYVVANNTAVELEFGATNTQAFIEWNSGGSAAVSASNRGRIRYNSTGQLFEISKNAASYEAIISGTLTTTRIPFASAAGVLADDSNLTWDNTNKRLNVATVIVQAFLAAGVGSNLTSGTTITPTNLIHHVTGTSTVSTITAPTSYTVSGNGGVLYIIPDGAFTWDTGGNIAVGGTAVTNRMITFVYDNGTSKWYPSYV